VSGSLLKEVIYVGVSRLGGPFLFALQGAKAPQEVDAWSRDFRSFDAYDGPAATPQRGGKVALAVQIVAPEGSPLAGASDGAFSIFNGRCGHFTSK
jgi:hypothetical protein